MAQVPATSYESASLGDVAEFTIPFPFLSRAEVFVTVDGASVPFTWINDGLVQLATVPELGAVVRRYRSTAAYVPLHQFSTGVPFLPRYVDRDFKQTLYAVQESVNDTAGTAAQALATAEESLVLVQDAFDILSERTKYIVLGAYGPGLNFQTTSQVLSYAGEFYAPGPELTLPYTTTGVGVGEIANFRPVGDAILRTDLAADTGITLVSGGVYSGEFIRSGTFQVGAVLTDSMHVLKHSDGFYYQRTKAGTTYPYTLVDAAPNDLDWRCVGLLGIYPVNDIRNFGAQRYPAYCDNALRLAINFVSSMPWRGSITATYILPQRGTGDVLIPQGWWRIQDTAQLNPGVRLKGEGRPSRIYGRKTPGTQVSGSVIFADPPTYQQKYAIDTANWITDDGVANPRRLSATTEYINSAQGDAYKVSWAEGSFVQDLYLINGPQGFFGGLRMHIAMKGGYDGLAVSSFENNISINQVWNQTLGDLWSEDSHLPLQVTEVTTQVAQGQHTLIGLGTTKMPTATANRLTAVFSGMLEDGATLAPGQKLLSRCLFSAYNGHLVFNNLTTEYAMNPILSRDTWRLDLINWHEEANGQSDPEGCLLAGWATAFYTSGMTSYSDYPFMSCGTGSKVTVKDAVKWEGESFKLAGFSGSSGNTLRIDSSIYTPKLSRGLNLEFVGKSPTMYCSTSGVATRYGTPTYPTTISGAVGGIVAGKTMTDATIQLTGTSQVHVMNNTANGTLAGTLEIYSDATSNTLASATTKPINCEKVLLKGFQLNTGTASAFGLDPQRGVVALSLQGVEVISGLGALSAVTILSDAVDMSLTLAGGNSAGMQSFIHPNSKKVAVHGAANSPSFTIGKLANVTTGINSTGFIP